MLKLLVLCARDWSAETTLTGFGGLDHSMVVPRFEIGAGCAALLRLRLVGIDERNDILRPGFWS
jgi:hypothetical protein